MKGLTGLFSVYQSAKGSVLGDSVAEWSARRTRNPDGSTFESRFGTCWICSRLFRVQILGHVCKKPIGCFLPVGVLNNPVTLYFNYLFLSI